MIIANIREVADYLKQNVGIIDVMKKEVQLDKAGSDLYKGVCCFHEEKTPSLTVTPSKQLYHCFGCKASGDIITFYREYHNMGTMEAIESIAGDHNIDIDRFKRELTEEEKINIELQDANMKVADGMHDTLLSADNRGTDYLIGRGLDIDTIKAYKIGYSPTPQAPLGIADKYADILELDKSNMWDDAMVYPLFDPYGRVIGFKNRPYWDGRSVDQKGRKLPKFMGTSSNSPLHKDDHIYGLHVARKNMDNGRLIGVEGQHDVLKSYRHGIKNIVGTDGTALNKDKIRILEEFGVRELTIVYDGDNAGREASYKVAKSVAELETTISIKVATLDEGMDPDEFLDKYGKIGLLKVVHDAVYAGQYLIDRVASEMSLSSVTGRVDFVKRVQPIIMKSPQFERIFLTTYVSEKIGVDQSVIEDMIRSEEARKSKSLLYNVEGEKIVLGGMLRDQDFRAEIFTEMKKGDWYISRHQLLFDMLQEMDNNDVPVSIDTVKSTVNNKGYNQIFSDGALIDDLFSIIGDYKTIKGDLIDKAIRRGLIKRADELRRNAHNLSNRLVLVVEEHMDNVQKSTDMTSNEGIIDSKSGATRFMDTLHDRMQNPNQIVGISLDRQFPSLTRVINGIQNKKLITVSANQSVGKTTLVANWMNELSLDNNEPWVHYSLEMPSEEVVSKIICLRAGVNSQKVERGNVTDDEYAKVQKATIDYYNSGLIIIDDQTTLEGIINTTRKLIRTKNIKGASIDYIQLMHVERSKSRQRYEELGDISGGLKNDMAKKLDIPVIILSQLSKSALDSNVAKAEHGAGSYKIAQDSDIYITLKEKTEEEIQEWGIENGNLVMNIDKNRGGKADVLLDILFQKDLQRMIEVRGNE